MNGPTVNRALLNQLYPAGTTQKNTGTVNFDNPDRHLPYSYQTSVGIEKQLPASIAVSADYVHLNMRDLQLRVDLNQGLRANTGRTAALTRFDPNFAGAVLQLSNLGWANYDGLQTSVQKRFSHGYQFRVSYTYSKAQGNLASPGALETITSATIDPVTRVTSLNPDQQEGLTSQDRPHLLSMNGSMLVPKTKGLQVSGVVQYNSGTPFTLIDSSTDPNRNGNFEEPLPAGTYSGAATNVDAITVENAGGIRGARGPSYFLINMRGGYRFKLPGGRELQAHVDVFNLTNHANFNSPTAATRRRS